MTGKDAFVVKRLRAAGALMLAKSNMAEFAFSPVETVNSILPGYTRNPYDTSRVTAGSSGGSAAAAAANFGAIALGSDTGDSIRGPSAAPGARRPAIDDGPREPLGRRAAEPRRRHRGRAHADGRGHGGRAAGDRRPRSGRSGDRERAAATFPRATRRRSWRTGSRARASACCTRRTTRRRPIRKSSTSFTARSTSSARRAPWSSTRSRSPASTRCGAARTAAATSSSTT